MTRIPKFDKRTGILFALDSAMKREIKWMETEMDEALIASGFPKDKDLKETVRKMIVRAKHYYKEEK